MNLKTISKSLGKGVAGLLAVGFVVGAIVTTTVRGPELYGKYIRTTVGLKVVEMRMPNAGGTGFHVKGKSGKTYILTNKHICDGLTEIQVRLEGTDRFVPRKVIEIYPKHDLCLVEPMPDVEGLTLGSELDKGDVVSIVGHPHLNPLTLQRGEVIEPETSITMPTFNITAEECAKRGGEFLDVSGNIMAALAGVTTVCLEKESASQAAFIAYPGNSGSPIVNFYGNVVGVMFAGSRESVNNSFMVPLSVVKEFLSVY